MSDTLRQRLSAFVGSATTEQLTKLDDYAQLLALAAKQTPLSATTGIPPLHWPHAPVHRLSDHGTFIVTGSTLHKVPLFKGKTRLDALQESLLQLAQQHGWDLEAWAIFPNHYHFVTHSTEHASNLGDFLKQLHADTARDLNQDDKRPGRQVWFNFWETQLTFENSDLALLAYVHQNAVRHGVVRVANQYAWCSAGWFERTARPAQVETIYSFQTDEVEVRDEYDVEPRDVV